MAGNSPRSYASKTGVGVIGLGHWGPNYLRTFSQLPEVKVIAAADPDKSRLKQLEALHREVLFHRDYRQILENDAIRAVVIATPSSTHYQLVHESLLAGKDVLCEKPLSLTPVECVRAEKLARRKKLILMVAHIFMYNPGIQKIKAYIDEGKLGDLYFLASSRTNLGPVRDDVNVVFDLAAHDVSIFNFALGATPRKALASGGCFLKKGREDFCFINLHYPGGILGHIHLSWLTPRKQREMLVVGSRSMIVWNDLDPLEPLKVYHAGSMNEPFYSDYGAFQRMARASDVHLPAIDPEEPLLAQNRHFIHCVKTRKTPLSDGKNAFQVVKTLQMIQKALSDRR